MDRRDSPAKYLKHLASVLLIVGLGYYLWRHWSEFSVTLNASWPQVTGLFVCIILTWIISSLQSFFLLRHMGVAVMFWENLTVSVAMILGNYLPMRVGSIIRMRYFKKIYGLQYSGYLGLAGAKTLIILFSCSMLVTLGLIYMGSRTVSFDWIFVVLLFGVMAAAVGFLLVPWDNVRESSHFLARKLSYFFTALGVVRSYPALFWKISGLVVLQFVILALRLRLSFDAVNVDLNPGILLVMAPTITLISFLSLTPGNLGLREWAIGVITLSLGLDFNSGIYAATVDRAMLLLSTFVLGPVPLAYAWYRTMR